MVTTICHRSKKTALICLKLCIFLALFCTSIYLPRFTHTQLRQFDHQKILLGEYDSILPPAQATTSPKIKDTEEEEDEDPCAPLENPPRLELVHIPKTGGTSLEITASQNGIAWSYCHWGPSPPCPPHPKRRSLTHHGVHTAGVNNWHVPPMYFDADERPVPFDPYQNATLFTIVRNPYDRAVSQ
jgi:hypothetical protein